MNNSRERFGNAVRTFLILILITSSAAVQNLPESVRQDVTQKW